MKDIVKFENLKDFIVELRGQGVMLDSDVAQIYGVETRDINKAVANNPDKFPAGYIVELSKQEKNELVENFHRFGKLKHSTVNPKAFPEKGLYMLATILKSPKAVQATLSIIETFSKIRQLSRNIKELSTVHDKNAQKALMQQGGELIEGIFGDDLQTSDTETSIELNFAVLKFKHVIKKQKNKISERLYTPRHCNALLSTLNPNHELRADFDRWPVDDVTDFFHSGEERFFSIESAKDTSVRHNLFSTLSSVFHP